MRKNTTIRRKKNKMNGGGNWSWTDVMGNSYSKNSRYLIGKFILVLNSKNNEYEIYKVLGLSSEKGRNNNYTEYTQHNCIKYDLNLNRSKFQVVEDTDDSYNFECVKTSCGDDTNAMAVKPVLLRHGTRMKRQMLQKMKGEKFAVLGEFAGNNNDDTPNLFIPKVVHDKFGPNNSFIAWCALKITDAAATRAAACAATVSVIGIPRANASTPSCAGAKCSTASAQKWTAPANFSTVVPTMISRPTAIISPNTTTDSLAHSQASY